MTLEDCSFSASAREMIERQGKSGLNYTHDRIDTLRVKGNPREINQAQRLLSEIEHLLEKETP